MLAAHCLVLRCLQILELSLIIAQNQTDNIPRVHKPRRAGCAAQPKRRASRPAAGAGPWRGDYREPFGLSFCSRGLSGCFGCLSALLGFPLAVPFR